MLSPQDQIKLKALTKEVESALGKSKFAEFMDLTEKSEDEDEGKEQDQDMPSESQKETMRAGAMYPNQGKAAQ